MKVPYRAEWSGEFQEMEEAEERLAKVFAISLVLIVILLYMAFRSILDAAVVFANVLAFSVAEVELSAVADVDPKAAEEAASRYGAKYCYTDYHDLLRHDAEAGELVPCAPFGHHEAELLPRLKPGEGATGRVFLTGQPVVVQDYDTWEGRVTSIPLAFGI